MKKILFSVLLCGFFVPFVLQTDLYPFLRYAMFAEPIRYENQLEQFQVLKVSDTKKSLLDPMELGIHQSTFDYLARNHFYREEAPLFLEKIRLRMAKSQEPQHLELIRIIQTDTLVVAKF